MFIHVLCTVLATKYSNSMTNEKFERENVTNIVDMAPFSCKMLQLGQA
jgi:hypothetical protein